MSKPTVIDQYRADYHNFMEVVDRAFKIPDIGSKSFVGNWGIHEILSHIAAWDPETIAAIEVVTQGKVPWFFDHEKDIDKFNQRQIDTRKNSKNPQILAEIGVNHAKLIDFLEKFPAENFHRSYGIVWHDKPLTPSLVCSYRHYATHAEDIISGLVTLPGEF